MGVMVDRKCRCAVMFLLERYRVRVSEYSDRLQEEAVVESGGSGAHVLAVLTICCSL